MAAAVTVIVSQSPFDAADPGMAHADEPPTTFFRITVDVKPTVLLILFVALLCARGPSRKWARPVLSPHAKQLRSSYDAASQPSVDQFETSQLFLCTLPFASSSRINQVRVQKGSYNTRSLLLMIPRNVLFSCHHVEVQWYNNGVQRCNVRECTSHVQSVYLCV